MAEDWNIDRKKILKAKELYRTQRSVVFVLPLMDGSYCIAERTLHFPLLICQSYVHFESEHSAAYSWKHEPVAFRRWQKFTIEKNRQKKPEPDVFGNQGTAIE